MITDLQEAVRARFDAVVMLTASNWHTEPRSNRYHYATRLARDRPVVFVQADCRPDECPPCGYRYEASGYPGIDLLHVSSLFNATQALAIAAALAQRKIKRPLLWFYRPEYGAVAHYVYSPLRVFHATEDYFLPELRQQVAPEFFTQLQRLFNRIDLVVAVSTGVRDSYAQHGGGNPEIIVLENGCDYAFWEHYSHLTQGNPPAHLDKVAFYQGGINFRLDYALIRATAALLPDWQFWFCGVRDPKDAEWQTLAQLKNVRDLGVLPPEQLAATACQATVGIIPFVQTPMIVDVSLPLKAFEYVACGLPVVTVPIRALAAWPNLFANAATPAAFAAAIQRVAPTRDDPAMWQQRSAAAAHQDYDRRYETLLEHITRPTAPARYKILILYSANSVYTATVQEHLAGFARYSRHDVFFADAVNGAPFYYDMALFDVVVMHYSVRLTLDDYISPHIVQALALSGTYKILFIQDEYENTERTRRWMDQIGFHTVYTCVPTGQIGQVYPFDRFPGTQFMPNLTGYVPESLEQRTGLKPLAERPIVLGYRGRELPFSYGDLAREKLEIGQKMQAICAARAIPHDIEWHDKKRIYGAAWYDFIANCRAVLGTESGCNVFDFDGDLQTKIDAALQQDPTLTYDALHARFIADRDGLIKMNQVSPRVFEAIALRTALVLYEGTYSGVVQPMTHYLPLKKDLSNVDWVLEKLQDLPFLTAMTERAYRDVIQSQRYSYQVFIAAFDAMLETEIGGAKPHVILHKITGAVAADFSVADTPYSGLSVPEFGAILNWPIGYEKFDPQLRCLASIPYQAIGGMPVIRPRDLAAMPTRLLLLGLVRQLAVRFFHCFPLPVRAAFGRWLQPLAHYFNLM
jgi:glycosyltransferase involved in cell wall biosynthesis